MRIKRWATGGLAAAAIAFGAAPAYAASTGLDAYRVEATAKNLKALAAAGFDVTEGHNAERGTIDVVGSARQIGRTKVGAKKVTDFGDDARVASAEAPTDGADDSPYTVWTKYDAVADDDKEQYTEQYDRVVAEHPDLVKKRVVGKTYGGRDIIALQVTKGATGTDIGDRPAVLYNAMQHAREWLAGETCRRTLDYFLDNYGKTHSAGLEVTRLVDTVELWFVCVNNPDGYEYTFTEGNRLWRKNLADNNGDGQITDVDGVDPNRNFSSNWGRDNDGSSNKPESDTYRGPSPASEPETKAMEELWKISKPVFQKNDHTAAQLLLYPQGFQQDTQSADHEIFTALAGDPFKPGIEGFLPELSAGLYITNGDFTDWAYNSQGTLSFTPEGTAAEDPTVTGFEYPDSPLQVDQEFDRHLPFVLDLANSADDPTQVDSHLGNEADDFAVETFGDSYGDPQPVQATVKRNLGNVILKFRVNGGKAMSVPTVDYKGGEDYYKDPGVFYRRVRGVISGTKPGDKVTAWFQQDTNKDAKKSAEFEYTVRADSDSPVLLLSDEDWSGVQPNPQPLAGPKYLDSYTKALDALGVKYDIYDVSKDRRAPDPLGVLAHYSHVVWYTGDDYVPRAPDAPGGSGIDRLAVDTQNNVRDFMNDGGKVFYTGKNAGRVFTEGYTYNPFQVEEKTYCQGGNPSCIAIQDDFLQYHLGAYRYVGGAGEDADANPFPIKGTDGTFNGLDFTLNGEDSAKNNDHTATLLVTSSVLNPAQHPLFADSKAKGAWQRPGSAPFEPFTGDYFMSAGADDQAYKRLQKEFTLTGDAATGATLSFRTSFDLEPDYDYQFVEIHTVGEDNWTTLADANGHTSDDTGASCPAQSPASDWHSNHPFLAHYQTKVGSTECTSSGTSGDWNAATGNSGGWQEWEVPIPAEYLGQTVEVSITVASDPATTGLGNWIDDLQMLDAQGDPFDTADPSFEAGTDDWTTPGPPPPAGPGGQSDVTGWERLQSAPFVETPIAATTDTVFTGFAFEAITGADKRQAFMKAVLDHLGPTKKPAFDAPTPKPDPDPQGPPITPPGQIDPRPNGVHRLVFGRQRLSDVRRRGVRAQVTCPGGCPLAFTVRVDSATKRRYRLHSTTLGRLTTRIGPLGRKTFRIKWRSRTTQSRLRRAKRVRFTVTATVPNARSHGTVTRRLTVR